MYKLQSLASAVVRKFMRGIWIFLLHKCIDSHQKAFINLSEPCEALLMLDLCTLVCFTIRRHYKAWKSQDIFLCNSDCIRLKEESHIKSNQITFIVTSPQHKCLGEWNSYERAPDSAEKQQTIYIWTDSAKKQQTIDIWTDSAKKQQQQFTYGQTVQKKQHTTYIWTDSAKKQQQFTYGQYIFTDCTEDNVQNTYTQYT